MIFKQKIDMVDVFRSSKYVFNIAKEAVSINAAILWMQEGVIDDKGGRFCKKRRPYCYNGRVPKKNSRRKF